MGIYRAKNIRWRSRASLLVAAASVALYSTAAQAHFILVAPASFAEQDALGSPQKSLPCGQADPGQTANPTGELTTFTEGQTITLTINETIFHPGHYRVSIAQDQASIPPDPPVTPGSTDCGSTVITMDPQLPLVADGLLEHSSAFSGPQSVQVKLPAGLVCTNCTLQVAEFMSNHGLNNPGGCFYHHCANITILPAGDAGPGAGGGGPVGSASASSSGAGGGDGASGGDGGSDNGTYHRADSGCGCHIDDAESPSLARAGLLFALGVLLHRRRRRAAGSI